MTMLTVRSYGQYMDFGYVCPVTLTFVQDHDIPLGHGQQIVWNIIPIKHGSEEL